jgi:hypothetical protein
LSDQIRKALVLRCEWRQLINLLVQGLVFRTELDPGVVLNHQRSRHAGGDGKGDEGLLECSHGEGLRGSCGCCGGDRFPGKSGSAGNRDGQSGRRSLDGFGG